MIKATLEFVDYKTKLPDGDYECVLWVRRGGLLSDQLVGPIAWSSKNNVWLDLFAMSEAGELIDPKNFEVDVFWAKWEPQNDD